MLLSQGIKGIVGIDINEWIRIRIDSQRLLKLMKVLAVIRKPIVKTLDIEYVSFYMLCLLLWPHKAIKLCVDTCV